MTKKVAQKNMARIEKTYDNIKSEIEFKVANRPLLVEQVSKAFIHNLNQIKQLQRHVNFLRETGHNPDEHLTNEQKELLVSAEYYDRLNIATAYFPSQNGGQGFTMQEGAVTFGMPGGMEIPDGQNIEGADQIVEVDEDGDQDGEGDEMEGDQDQEDAYNQIAAA